MASVDYGSLIAEAARRLADAEPEAGVILFGSHARGEARPNSDLDLLVIEPKHGEHPRPKHLSPRAENFAIAPVVPIADFSSGGHRQRLRNSSWRRSLSGSEAN